MSPEMREEEYQKSGSYILHGEKDIVMRIVIGKCEMKEIKRHYTLKGRNNVIRMVIINEGGNITIEDKYVCNRRGARNNVDILVIGSGYSSTTINVEMMVEEGCKISENILNISAYKFSHNARIEISPEMSIKCRDIRSAIHGGKIKCIQGNEKVYLDMRGLGKEEVKRMLVNSFLDTMSF